MVRYVSTMGSHKNKGLAGYSAKLFFHVRTMSAAGKCANRKRSEKAKEAVRDQPRNEDGTMAEKPSAPTSCGNTRSGEDKNKGPVSAAIASNTNRGAVERKDTAPGRGAAGVEPKPDC
jgi:hypothetical protein